MTIQLAKDQATNESENGATVESLFLSIQAGFDPISALDDFINRSMQIYAEAKAKEFAGWLHENRWFSFTNGKWNYSFEHGTAISDATYEKNYRKTTEELYEKFKTQ